MCGSVFSNDNRTGSFSCGLAVKAVSRTDERSRLHLLMMFMFFLREIQRNRSIRFTIYELLHFGVRTVANFTRRTLRDNRAMTKHDHARRDSKRAGHVVSNDHCGQMFPMG